MPALIRKLDRYVLREIGAPFLVGLLVWTFILLMDALFDAAETIIQRNVPAILVGKLLALSLPHVVVLTIPMAFLFAILIAVGRLAADSELVALRASGISLFSLYRPVLMLSAVLAGANAWLMIELLPWGNHAQQNLLNQIMAQSVTEEISPRVFHELDDKILYVFERPLDESRWRGVFVADAVPKTEHRITVAATGNVRLADNGEQVILSLHDATDQEMSLLRPSDLKMYHHQVLDLLLEDQLLRRRHQLSTSKWVRELSWEELRRWASDPDRPALERNSARVEIHKKFAIPAACLVFGLFGVPLGFNNRRGGSKSSGFAVSIAVILVYYILLNNGEEAAALGKASPWLAMWTPNLLFTVAGTFLLARRNRDKSLLLTRVDRWIRRHLWARLRVHRRVRTLRRLRRRRRRQEATMVRRAQFGHAEPSRLVLRLPRPRLVFPNLFDRYVIGLFVRVFLVVVVAGTSIYIIANLTELVDDIMRNDVPSSVVVDYYKYMSLQIFYTIAPVVVLLTTLVTFALLSRSNEVTAAKALGLSLYRLAVPAVVAALLVAGLSAILESSVLPASNARVAELKDRIMGRDTVRTYRRADRLWLFGKGDSIYNYLHFDPDRQILQRLQIFRFDEKHRLAARLYADQARYDGQRWIVTGAWARQFHDGDREAGRYTPLPGPQPVDIPEEPSFFDTEIKSPEQMNYQELRAYIAELRAVGQEVPELEVELHNKLAMPVVCVVMALVALPFAFRLGKAGALYGVGIALVLGMVYYAILAFFTTLGAAAALPPVVAAWSPNVFFALVSLYLFLGVRT
jgi:LPS export ABC transporter permease LptG/LPS export ABC transporter permease LptF